MTRDVLFICCEGAVFVACIACAWWAGHKRGYKAAKRHSQSAYDQGFTAGELGGITEGYARCLIDLDPKPIRGRNGKFVRKDGTYTPRERGK